MTETTTTTTQASPFLIPPELTEQHIAILGKTGSGKSTTAKGYVEKLLERGVRVCIYDPTGVWWGLRFKGPGHAGFALPHVGGEFGELPLDVGHGESLARYVGEHDGSIIVDTSEMTIGDKHRFATAFFRKLFEHNRRTLYLIIDEADEVVPQNPMKETRVLLHHVDRIVRRGRVRGFVVTLISQRPAVLHKNVLSQANTLIAMRLTASQDRDAVKAWIQGQADIETGKRVLAALPSLQRGEGFVWSPEFDVLQLARFPLPGTFDSMRTPKHGEPPMRPPTHDAGDAPRLAAAGLDALRSLLERAPPKVPQKRRRLKPSEILAASESAEKINTPPPAPPPNPDQLDEARRRGYEQGHADGFKKGYAAASAALSGCVHGVIRKAEEFLTELREIAQKLADQETDDEMERIGFVHGAPGVQVHRAGQLAVEVSREVARMPWLRVLKVLAQRHPAKLGVKDWAMLAGMVSTGGAWAKHLRALRLREFVELVDGGLYRCTPAGLEAAGVVPEQPGNVAELRRMWGEKIGGRAGEIIELLARVHPDGLHRDAIAEHLDMRATGGAFARQLRLLKNNDLVTVDGAYYRLADVLVK